jgi:hypothetical protein
VDDGSQELGEHALQRARRDRHGERGRAAGRVDVLDWHPERSRGGAAGDRRPHVHHDSVPEQALRAGHRGRVPGVGVRPRHGARRAGRGLLRRGEPGRGLCGRPALLQHARRAYGGRGRRDGGRDLEGSARRHQHRRIHDHGAHCGRGDGARRQQRRRVRRARVDHGARPGVRRDRVAGLQHRPGQRGLDRSRDVPPVLRGRPRA